MISKKIKLKISIPDNANVYAELGDKTYDLLIYEVDQLEVLEEVVVEKNKVKYNVKDGQYVNKGDIIFTEGLLGHKAMVCDVGGIVEINEDRCKILGQKKHFERRINIDGRVTRLLPKKLIQISSTLTALKPVLYRNFRTKLTPYVYLDNKSSLTSELIQNISLDTTFFINDNLYLEELAKIIALGVRRIIVNGVFIDNLDNLKKEINKLEGFAVISGFGDRVSQKFRVAQPDRDLIWGKVTLYFSDTLSINPIKAYEHPHWGVSGDLIKTHDLIAELDYNHEALEIYIKNLEYNEQKKSAK